MLAILLYLMTCVTLVALWRRFVRPMTNAAAIVLVLLPFCFTGRALLSGGVYAPLDMPFMSEPLQDYKADFGIDRPHNAWLSDLYMQMIPWQSAVRQTLAHGDWPLWNRHMLAGSILASNMQAAPYDPLQLLGFLLPHPQALTFGAAMTFFIAGLFVFTFARAIGLSEAASFIGAAAYMFNGVLAFFVGWPIGRAWTFLPLVLLGVRMVVRETGLRGPIVLTSGFVLLIFAGHPETVLHVVFLGMVWGVYELVQIRDDRRAVLRAIGRAGLCGALALMLTAISLLPFSAAAPHTKEYEVRHERYAPAKFIIPKETIVRRALVSLFPFHGGQPWRGVATASWDPTSMRVGSLVLALALASLVLAHRRRGTWFFFGLAVFCVLTGLNEFPVGHLLHALPLFDITLNERLVFGACFALAMLAAIAIDSWDGSRARLAAAIVVVTGIALGLGAAFLRDAQIAEGVDPGLFVMLVLAELVPLAILAIVFAMRTPPRIALPLVLGLVLVQRTLVDGSMYPVFSEKVFYPDIPILRHMKEDPQTPFRMVGLHFALVPDAAALYGLEDVRGYEAMTFARLHETYPLWCTAQDVSFNNVVDRKRPFLSMLNVKYAVGTLDAQPDDQWKLVLQDRNSRLLENTRVLPRAFIPKRVRYERTKLGVFSGMRNATDFGEKGWITARDYSPHEISNGPGTLTIRRDAFDYDIDAVMELDGWVFVSESAWPGWRAYVDGKRVETQYANHAFLGVFVPKGRHNVKLVFVPEAFTRGRNITFATMGGLVIFFMMRRRRVSKSRRAGL